MNDQGDNTVSSEDLMAKIGAGDRYAFEVLVRRHQRPVLNFIYRFLGDLTEAEDLAQEVFLRVWQSAAAYKPTAKFTSWLYRIAVNLCINKQKSDRIKKLFMVPFSRKEEKDSVNESSIEHSEKTPSPEDLLLVAERKQQILNAIQQLPANQKVALILKRYDDFSCTQSSEFAADRSRSLFSDSLLASQGKKPQVFSR